MENEWKCPIDVIEDDIKDLVKCIYENRDVSMSIL